MTHLPRLFHKTSKGNINIWDIWPEGDTIHTKWGQKDGKQQEAAKVAKPKNVGKKNATTAEEQAVLEAKAMWTKKLDKKYYETEHEALNELVFLPMLADSFEKRKKFVTEADYPVSIQPKLDGLRCLVYWSEGKVKLMSRGGKEYILPHISKAAQDKKLGNQDVLDGELYIHGESLQELNRLVRGSHKYPESVNVQYHVYDMISKGDTDMPWSKREVALAEFGWVTTDPDPIRFTRTTEAFSEEEVLRAQRDLMRDGYEGAIVRLKHGKYRFGFRSKELLKVKSFQDAEFKITGFTNGVGKFSECIIYTCVTEEGNEFSVVPKGTFEERREMLAHGELHIGQMLKVQFADWTEDMIPQFPVGLCIRLEEDM